MMSLGVRVLTIPCVLLLLVSTTHSLLSQYSKEVSHDDEPLQSQRAQMKILSKRSALYVSVFRSGRLHAHSAGLSKYSYHGVLLLAP